MALAHSPKITTDGLVFAYDMGNRQKSWKGAPTTNLITASLSGMSGVTLTYLGIDDGWKKYSMSGTFTGGTYPFIMNMTSTSFTGGVTYSSSCFIKTNVANKFNYFATAMNYVNQPMTKGGTSFSIAQPDGSFYIGRSNFAYTSTTTQLGYISTNPINNTTFDPATDFVWFKNGQVELGEFPTPFAGDSATRSNTQAIADLMSTNTITATSLTYAADNTFSFNGSNNYIDSGPVALTGTSTQSLTWACWVSPATASGDIINMVSGGWNMCPIYASGQIFNGKVWSSAALPADFSFTLNQYYYLVLTRNNATNTNSFYVNGRLVASQTGATYSSSGNANNHYFGRAGSQATNTHFNGKIPSGQIYTKALTVAEVQQNFNALRGRYGI